MDSELIEAATWALIEYDTDVSDRGVRDEHYRERRADVERVLAVFEAARKPTDDEREARRRVEEAVAYIDRHWLAPFRPGETGHELREILTGRLHRPVSPEPQTEYDRFHAGHGHIGPYCMPEPQTEPTDEQVRAAWDSLGPSVTIHLEYEQLIAALRAAAETADEDGSTE